ncbi:MAG TPA: ABC transporter substrate-binding protein [Anaerolineaceae bacterium]|nr:ABC transporter substrate-binding protein [Anaerolineaceae bacterium]
MRKNGSISLLLLCLLILVSACQAVTPTPTLPPTRTPTPVPPTATPVPTSKPTLEVDLQDLRGKEVKVAYPWVKDQNRVNQLIDDFNLTNSWGIRAVAESFGSDDEMSVALQKGDLDANVLIGKTYDLLNPDNQIVFVDLSNYINDPTWGALDKYRQGSPFEAFAPKANEVSMRFTLPLAFDAGLIYYRTGWAKELGLERVPLSWDDFSIQMQAGLQANLSDNVWVNNGTGGLLLSKSILSAQSWYAAFGGTYSLENQVLSLQDDALDVSFRTLKQAFVDDTSWVGLEPTPYQYFVDKYALAYEGTLSELNQQTYYLPEKMTVINWETIPYPTTDGKGSISLESISVGINAAEPEISLASWFFVRWMLQPSQQARLVDITGLWPATGHPAVVAADYAAFHPAWASALKDGVHLTLAPEAVSWGINRYILQDAYMRIYGLEPEYFSSIIDMLKQTLPEYPARQP